MPASRLLLLPWPKPGGSEGIITKPPPWYDQDSQQIPPTTGLGSYCCTSLLSIVSVVLCYTTVCSKRHHQQQRKQMSSKSGVYRLSIDELWYLKTIQTKWTMKTAACNVTGHAFCNWLEPHHRNQCHLLNATVTRQLVSVRFFVTATLTKNHIHCMFHCFSLHYLLFYEQEC